MFDKLIEGKLVTLLVGSVFRLVEILVRTVHITVRAVRLLVQELLTSRVDAWISAFGKRRLTATTRVDESSIVMIEQRGEYTGDPKYIAEEILRRGAPYRITWVLRDESVGPFPREFRFVRAGTADCFRAIARAKVVIQNGHSLQRSGAVKSRSQQWVQTGPASFGTRRPGAPRGTIDRRLREHHSAQTDLLLTSSPFEEEVFAASYWPGVPTLMLGHARNDILLDTSRERAKELRKKVLDRLDVLDTGQRFVLYAPARVAGGAATVSGIDVVGVRAALSERFGGTWDLLIRAHDGSAPGSDMTVAGLPAYCHDASFYPDLQELLVVADAGIADGSGWMGDYLLTRKPSFLYSTEPGTSNRELLSAIGRFDQGAHDREVAQLPGMDGNVDDGHAASRIVDRIDALMSASASHREPRP